MLVDYTRVRYGQMGWVDFVAKVPQTEVETVYRGLLRKPWEKCSQYFIGKLRSFWASSSSPCFSRVKTVFCVFYKHCYECLPWREVVNWNFPAGKARQSFQLLQSQSLELPSRVGFRAWLQSNTFELLIAVALLLNVSWKMLGLGDRPTLKVDSTNPEGWFLLKEGIVYTCLCHNCSMIEKEDLGGGLKHVFFPTWGSDPIVTNTFPTN